ncbi:MAG: putative intracellular protease/amidase [Chlamydiales bacterium]|jgi:putative intracellular protease/amidase
MDQPESAEQELDADGLVIQKYDSTVLVVLPPKGFGEQVLRYARSSLYNVHVGTYSVSTVVDELIEGRLQDAFMVDGPLSDASMDSYSGLLVVGGEGASGLAQDAQVLALVKAAHADGKLVAGWGDAVEVLALAGVVKGQKVTGTRSYQGLVEQHGGKYTGREIQTSGHIITARDEGAGMRFGQALAERVRI